MDDTVAFSTQELCRWTGMKPNCNPGKINEKYYDALHRMSKINYFAVHPDFSQLMKKRSNSNEYTLLSLKTEKFDVNDNFSIIYDGELQKILNAKEFVESSPQPAHLLLFLAYIRININKNPGQPRCCYRLFRTISSETGLSERIASRCAQALKDLQILDFSPLTTIIQKKSARFSTAPKIFADFHVYGRNSGGETFEMLNYSSSEEINRQINLLKEREVFMNEKTDT